MTEPEGKKCSHCERLARGDVYCGECMLNITKRSNNEALASQKSDLLAKVQEIISSTCIGDNTATKFREKIKKRIEELA